VLVLELYYESTLIVEIVTAGSGARGGVMASNVIALASNRNKLIVIVL